MGLFGFETALPAAGTLAAIDGPIPIGDAAAIVLLSAAAINETSNLDEAIGDGEECKSKCCKPI